MQIDELIKASSPLSLSRMQAPSTTVSDAASIKPIVSQDSILDMFNESKFEPEKSVEENSFKNSAALKMQTSKLAMHLKREARDEIFANIDYLLDPEEFDVDEDSLISLESYKTFLRFLTYSPDTKPTTLGVAFGGEVIAIWVKTVGDIEKIINLEFLLDDHVRCSYSCVQSGEIREAFSYKGNIKRIDEVLKPYNAISLYKYGIHEA